MIKTSTNKNGGGANTNKNGLGFEELTSLADHFKNDLSIRYRLTDYQIKPQYKLNGSKDYKFAVYDKIKHKQIGVITKQMQFYNVLYQLYGIKNNNVKNWKPDEAFFNTDKKTLFIVEKKYQNRAGSVDEKIFGFNAKRILYQNLFNTQMKEPVIPVEFIALFNSSWWLYGPQNYHDYFDTLRNDGIKIMFDKYDDWFLGLNT